MANERTHQDIVEHADAFGDGGAREHGGRLAHGPNCIGAMIKKTIVATAMGCLIANLIKLSIFYN